MKAHPIVWQETKTVALGQLACCTAMVAVYWLMGSLSGKVAIGALVGGCLATFNFFAMALSVDMAADKGQQQDVSAGQALIRFSYLGRTAALFLILALCAKLGGLDPIALVLPLVFTRPILTIREFLHKRGTDSI